MKGECSVATISFDEKVIITDPKIIKMIKQDLKDTSPVVHKRVNNHVLTLKETEDNARKWVSQFCRSGK